MSRLFFGFRLLGIGMFAAMIAVFSAAAMLIWNALMPGVFGLPTLDYLQAAGMVVLARILFGGLGPRHGGRHGGDERLFGNALREKWMKMSEDEREEFMRSRRGFSHFHECCGERSGGKGERDE